MIVNKNFFHPEIRHLKISGFRFIVEEEFREIQKKYPYRLIELTNQLLEILNNE